MRENPMNNSAREGSLLSKAALRCCAWSERWFPDAFAFAVLAVAAVAVGAVSVGAAPLAVAQSFGSGFWSLIPFTMQMCFIIIGGFVVADSPPVARIVRRLAEMPRSPGAAACAGLGSVWALGLSSSAAQLQANPGSMPAALLAETGVIPFSETIFLWQSMLCAAILAVTSTWIAWKTAPGEAQAQTARELGIDLAPHARDATKRTRPGEWLEYSPLPSLFIVALEIGRARVGKECRSRW